MLRCVYPWRVRVEIEEPEPQLGTAFGDHGRHGGLIFLGPATRPAHDNWPYLYQQNKRRGVGPMTLLTVVAGDGRGATALETDEISFGRSTSATIKLDISRADRSLSRISGVFKAAVGHWQVINTATRGQLDVIVDGGVRASLAPGAAPLILPMPSTGRVQVQTVQTYLIHMTVTGGPLQQSLPEPIGETTTITVARSLDLSTAERRLIIGLAEPRLRDPDAGAWTVASAAQLQDRLHITTKQIDHLIEAITVKISPYVSGLIGSNSGRAITRRHQIVDFAIRSGCVGPGDLRDLDPDR